MILTLILTVSTAFAFNGEKPVNKQALNAFKIEFAKATDAVWTACNDLYQVSFTLNEQKLFAYYNQFGEFMAVTHNISSCRLPHYLQRSLKKSYSHYWISDLFEITNLDETAYYVTLETADVKIVLRSDNGNAWTVFQKIEKV